jgi:hypothetical protein
MFEVHGDEASATFRNQIRLSFSWESEENIKEGVTRLLQVLRCYNEGPGAGDLLDNMAEQEQLRNSYK